MQSEGRSCIKRVGGTPTCHDCNTKLIKHDLSTAGKTRYKCTKCRKTSVSAYTYRAYNKCMNYQIVMLTKEGVGIRSTARILRISTTTLMRRLRAIAQKIARPVTIQERSYEVDEVCTFLKSKDKLIWIVYALDRQDRKVVSFSVGPRTNKTLNVVLKILSLSKARSIHTDQLQNYKFLIDGNIHKTEPYGTNHIERKNLSLRTHLKRLSRRTICFSRSIVLLEACLAIYFYS